MEKKGCIAEVETEMRTKEGALTRDVYSRSECNKLSLMTSGNPLLGEGGRE